MTALSVKRSLITITGAALAAAALAACGGGSGSTAAVLPSSPSQTNTGGSQPASSAKLTLTFVRGNGHKKASAAHRAAASAQRAARTARSPKYISENAQGLQVAVTVPGGATQTVYADISSSSPLCSVETDSAHARKIQQPGPSGTVTSCTIPMPLLAPGDTIAATEIDEAPQAENNGLGTGFAGAADDNVLAYGSTTVSAGGTPGTVIVTNLALDPVLGPDMFYDCGPVATTASVNANDVGSSDGNDSTVRIVVTGGVASTLRVQPQTGDADHNYFEGTAGQPFVDPNGAKTAVTMVSSASDVTLASVTDPAVSTSAESAFAGTAMFADSGAQTNVNANDPRGCFTMLLDVKYDGTTNAPSTIVVSNNDNAANPTFMGTASYFDTFTYDVVPITASVPSTAMNLGDTQTVTANDEGAGQQMDTAGCVDATGNVLATATYNNDYVAATGAQTFALAATAAGTCTLTFTDDDTVNSNIYALGVETQPITITISGGSSPVTINAKHRR